MSYKLYYLFENKVYKKQPVCLVFYSVGIHLYNAMIAHALKI